MTVNSRILDVTEDGRKVIHHYDYATGKTTVETQMDVEHMLDINKALHNEGDPSTRYKGEMVRVASIPTIVWMQLKQQGIVDDPKAYKRWLNDPENRFFRTSPGKV